MFLEKNRAFFSIFLIFQTLKSMKRTKIDFRVLKYTAHLLRCHANSNPQRIIDTPAVGICVAPCICAVYFKRLTERVFSGKRFNRS